MVANHNNGAFDVLARKGVWTASRPKLCVLLIHDINTHFVGSVLIQSAPPGGVFMLAASQPKL